MKEYPRYHYGDVDESNKVVIVTKDILEKVQKAGGKLEGLEDSVDILKPLCNQENKFGGRLLTNQFKLVDKRFNNYRDNYWWPHEDDGYTAIIYLNQF